MGLSRKRSTPRQIETFRRLGLLKRHRQFDEPWPPQRAVFRIRRGRIVQIPPEWIVSRATRRRKVWGRGRTGRMDEDRQKRVARAGKSRRRHFSYGYDSRSYRIRERADRAYLRQTITAAYEEYKLDELDRWDECGCDDCLGFHQYFEWKDPRWAVTLLDLMR